MRVRESAAPKTCGSTWDPQYVVPHELVSSIPQPLPQYQVEWDGVNAPPLDPLSEASFEPASDASLEPESWPPPDPASAGDPASAPLPPPEHDAGVHSAATTSGVQP